MNEEIQSGLIQDVRELDPAALSASAADGTDGGGMTDATKDQDRTDGADADGTDGGDSDGTDAGGDTDGTDGGDSDGTDNA